MAVPTPTGVFVMLVSNRLADLPAAKRIFTCALILAALSWLVFFKSNQRIIETGSLPGSDFIALYTGAVLAECCPDKLYDTSAQFGFEQTLGPEQFKGWKLHYLYPPFFSVLLAPLGNLSYSQAYWLWTAASLLLYGLSVAILFRGQVKKQTFNVLTIFTVAAASPALHWILHSGQTTALGIFLWTVAYDLLRSGRFFLSGLALGLLAYRPQFLLLLPICLIKLPNQVTAGFALCLLLLFVAGGLGISFDSYGRYLQLLQSFGDLLKENLHPLTLHISIYGFFRPLMTSEWSLALTVGVSLLVAYWLIRIWSGPVKTGSDAFELQFAGLIASTLLVMWHSLIYDVLLLTIVALIIENQKTISRRIRVILTWLYCLPLLFFFFADSLKINPIQPLLVWLSFELYRASKKAPAVD